MRAQRAQARLEGIQKAIAPFAGRHTGRLFRECIRHLVVEGEHDGPLAWKVSIEQPGADAGARGHIPQSGGLVAALANEPDCRFVQLAPHGFACGSAAGWTASFSGLVIFSKHVYDNYAMKIVIPGGSGQVGTMVARAFHEEGHEVVVLGRRPRTMPWQMVEWDGARLGPWVNSLDGADVLLNLTGRSVNCRYTPANRREIIDSRVRSTHVLGQALTEVRRPPAVWLQASTATIYAHRYDAANDEIAGIIGGDEVDAPDTWRFSIDVARAWELAFNEVPAPATRKVTLRSAMTMSADRGGVFDALLALVRRGQGGRIGDGRQYMSWVHEADFIRAMHWRDALVPGEGRRSPCTVDHAELPLSAAVIRVGEAPDDVLRRHALAEERQPLGAVARVRPRLGRDRADERLGPGDDAAHGEEPGAAPRHPTGGLRGRRRKSSRSRRPR